MTGRFARCCAAASFAASMLFFSFHPADAASTLEGHYEWIGPNGYHGSSTDMNHTGRYGIVDVTQNRGRWRIQWQSTVAPWYTIMGGVSSAGVAPAHLHSHDVLVFDGNDDYFHHIAGRFERASLGDFSLILAPIGRPYKPVFTGGVYGKFTLRRYGPVRLIPLAPESRY